MLSVLAADTGNNDGALLPFLNKLWNKMRWLLAIRVDGDGGVAIGVGEAGGEGGFLAEIARKGKDNEFFVFGRKLLEDIQSTVR